VQNLSAYLPFKWTFGFPIEALIGQLNNQQLLSGLLSQAAWIGAGILLVAVVWRFGIRRYSAVGS
jgi:ABC-2 type transport system permease protein